MRQIARRAALFRHQRPAAHAHRHASTVAIAVARSSIQGQRQVVPRLGVVAPKQGALPGVAHENIQVAVVVVIGHGRAAPDQIPRRRSHASSRARIDKTALTIVEVQLIALAVGGLWIKPIDVLVNVSIGDVEIGVAVVVGVEEIDAKGQLVQAASRYACGQRFVGKHPAACVVVQGVALPLEIGHRQVEAPIAVAVGHIHAHRPFGLAAGIVRHANHQPHFHKATAVVAPEKIRGGVVALKQIGIAIEIEIDKRDS